MWSELHIINRYNTDRPVVMHWLIAGFITQCPVFQAHSGLQLCTPARNIQKKQ